MKEHLGLKVDIFIAGNSKIVFYIIYIYFSSLKTTNLSGTDLEGLCLIIDIKVNLYSVSLERHRVEGPIVCPFVLLMCNYLFFWCIKNLS